MTIEQAGSPQPSALIIDEEYRQGPTGRAFVYGVTFSMPLWIAAVSLVML